jgi:deoxyhypusine synthase
VKHATAGGPKADQKRAAEERERAGATHTMKEPSRFLRGNAIDPRPIDGTERVVDLIEGTFLAYNAARLREACQLFVEKMLEKDVTIGLTMTGALTPAGLGMAAVIPLIEAGFVDWIISTGANLYHDTHFGLGLKMHRGNAQISDIVLREEGVVRIYDVFFDYDVLLSTDAFFRQIIQGKEFQRPMSSAEFHWLCGKYVRERERVLGIGKKSLLGAAHDAGVPIYTSSPGDSSIGMNVAALTLDGNKCVIDPNADVNETASIVLADPRRRESEELRPADRAADPGSAGDRRERARLLPADHRCPAGYGWSVRRDAGGSSELGEDRSGPAAGRGRLLPGRDGGLAVTHVVRDGEAEAEEAETAL